LDSKGGKDNTEEYVGSNANTKSFGFLICGFLAEVLVLLIF